MLRAGLWVCAFLAILPVGDPALANEARVLESSDTEITIELATDDYALKDVVHGGESFERVRARGYGSTSDVGLPRLPVEGALLGIPFGADLSLEIVSVESERLGPRRVEPTPREWVIDGEMPVPVQEYAPDDGFYTGRATYPESMAEIGFEATLRHQRTVQIVFHPFQYSAATGELTVHRRIVVRLTLRTPARLPGMRPVLVDEPDWEAVYSGVVLNYEQAKKWRRRPEPRRARLGLDLRQDHEAYKLVIRDRGIHRVDFADLADEGLAGSLDIDDVAIYQRSYDTNEPDPFVETAVPIVVVDADQDGIFDGADYLLFHAQSFDDQFLIDGYEDRYGSENVYWFGWGDGLAARMESRPGWLGAAGIDPPESFRDTLRYEEDVYYDSSPPSDYVDLYHWTDYWQNNDRHELPFWLYDIDQSGDVFLRARYQGIQSGQHRIDFSIVNGASEENSIGYYQFTGIALTMSQHIYTSAAISASYFTDGRNTLKTAGSLGQSGRSDANLDWFEWSYARRYEVLDGRLEFTNGGAIGTIELQVSGFGNESIRAFDVTDPLEPAVLELGEENVEPDGGGYRLVLQDEVARFTRYEAVEDGAYLSPVSIERREPANLHSSESDLIIVSYDGFSAGVEPLVAHRESQGLVVTHATLSQVYDEFRGGLASPQALRDYFMYAFDEWEREPKAVLLVGDGSEDTKGVLSSSSPNYMPCYLFRKSDQLQASDMWYVRDEGPTYLPKMFIGRLPSGGIGELENQVSKIRNYEKYWTRGDWRKNVLFVADDLWSYREFGSTYRRWGDEAEFTEVCEELGDVVAASPAGIDTTLFLLRNWTDPFHGSNTEGDIGYAIETADYVRQQDGATAHLLDHINEGAVIVNFQGHGNRTQLTHERLLLASSQSSSNDLPFFQNEAKPFIFMGFSCELARFFHYKEGTSIDCVTEQMLQRDLGQGAVATYACSAKVLLTHNSEINRAIFEAFFEDPTPEGPPSGYSWPRWALGATLTKGMVKYLVDEGYPSLPQTYVLLGDPLMHLEMSPPTIQVTVDGNAQVNEDFVEATPEGEIVEIVADIIDEVEIDPASISVVETDVGEIDPGEYLLEAIGDTLGELSRWYRLTYQAQIRPDRYDIVISATDMNGQRGRFILQVVEGEGVHIVKVANYPNPFDDSTSIIYHLSQSGAEVDISIFTVGGRLIRLFEDMPGNLNYNAVGWDGTDQDGDTVASGIYLYVISARGMDGSSESTTVGRMAKIGGMGP